MYQKKLDFYNYQVEKNGFELLNSNDSLEFHEQMRNLEKSILKDSALNSEVDKAIELYENEMLNTIYKYCENNHLKTAIFMCGTAHRKSLIEKITDHFLNDDFNINWEVLDFPT